jgi:hypothetical protein
MLGCFDDVFWKQYESMRKMTEEEGEKVLYIFPESYPSDE